MPINAELLKILVCPENKSRVRPLGIEELSELNKRIESGKIRSRSGVVINKPIEGALIREDGKVVYPIRESIPIMLIEEGYLVENS